jgi:hypothetical protein
MAGIGSIITTEEIELLQSVGLTGLVERVLLRIRELLKKIDEQAAQIQELKTRLEQNSQNSSRPPSQDPPGAQPNEGRGQGGGRVVPKSRAGQGCFCT